ncbi:response regulator transcription factor [Pedobacter sp. SYP-B3415]|uniref:response regulator n=1 Tax=Pedobacter sp. SYP-B3415 TaxID=2496641 RepID=UPI00101BDEE4|nr:response regulator transcription factor [Pedobacter sp. SYP-B3415]
MVNILLAEEQNIVRNGIRMLLETDQDISIIGEAVDAKEVTEFIKKGSIPDVVLSDIKWENHGYSLIEEIKSLGPDIKVVILTSHDAEKYLSRAFHEGADGFLLKTVKADELIFSLKHVSNGNRYIASELSQKMLNTQLNTLSYFKRDNAGLEISEKELLVMQSIADGLTNSEISEKLVISKRTIEGYRHSLIEKSGSKNTASLIRFAVLHGLVH